MLTTCPALSSLASPRAGHPLQGDNRIGRLAIRSLYREVSLVTKPGLVTPHSMGSHDDMNFATFVRSLSALRDYFPVITACGRQRPAFITLQALGVAAETAMLAATGGINTHRGAIFNLGLLCAAVGGRRADGQGLDAEAVCLTVRDCWAEDILNSAGQLPATLPLSHGRVVARRYGNGGARAEAASGFPAARELGLPAYRAILDVTDDHELAATQAFFALVAELEDTNLLWRGGSEGLAFGQKRARRFLAAGGVMADDWRQHAAVIDAEFVARRLSPGGSADLLGVTLFLSELEGDS